MILENMLSRKSKIIFPGIFFIFTLFPLALGLIYAFLYSIGIVGVLSNGFTLSHWKTVLSSESFIYSIGTSVLIAAVSLNISIILALFLTIVWEKNTKDKTQVSNNVFYIPLSIPPIIAAFLTFQFLGNSGLVSRFFYGLGLIHNAESFPDLVNDKWYIGVVFTQIIMTFPLLTLLFFNVYKTQKIDDLTLMSKTLGASERQILRRVVIPILLQKTQPNIILFFIFLMSSYEIPLLLGRQSPMMLSVLISQKFRKFNLADIPQAYVMTVIYALLVILLVLISQRTKRKTA